MTLLQLVSALLSLVAFAGWVNVKTARLPNGVAMLLVGLLVSFLLYVGRQAGIGAELIDKLLAGVGDINFTDVVMDYMLPFLLFAGATQVDLRHLRRRFVSVGLLATLGVAASIGIVGLGAWVGAQALGLPLSLPWAFVFGALISPTDPVAVLATVKHVRLSQNLRVILEGEALFNDGVGIVAYTALVGLAMGWSGLGEATPLLDIIVEALGGLALGMASGAIVIRGMHAVDNFAVETTMTIALATTVYALAQALGLSGAIAVVGAGMLFDSDSAKKAMSETTESYINSFWILVDEILNALLFLLLGLEILIVPFDVRQIGLLILSIPLVVVARFAVVMPWGSYFRARHAEKNFTLLLGWGGLHGGLSLALALALPAGPERNIILAMTYAVVTFSIVGQGLTLTPLAKRVGRDHPAD